MEADHVMNIIPIKDLQDTSKIAAMARGSNQPIFVTKNGYGELVIMSQDFYQRTLARQLIDESLSRSEIDYAKGRYSDGKEFFKQMRNKHGF